MHTAVGFSVESFNFSLKFEPNNKLYDTYCRREEGELRFMKF